MAALTSTPFPNHDKLSSSSASPRAMIVPHTVTLLRTCHDFEEVRQLHAQFITSGLLRRSINAGRLVESYVAVSRIEHALSVFNVIPCPDVFAYNTLMRGLTLAKDPYSSLLMCNKLLMSGLRPDNYTYTFVFKACSLLGALSEGKQVHCHMIKVGIAPDTYIHSSLIRMYVSLGSVACAERVLAQFGQENTLAKNAMISGYLCQGHIDKARAMFDKMEAKDVASWSAMTAGYTDNAMYMEALGVFREMMDSRVPPNESALVSALSACAHLGALDQGKWIHGYVDRVFGKLSVTLGTALIGMYAKCGSIETSYEVFKTLPQRDVVTWGAIISGFAIHGKPDKCFRLFDQMVSEGIQPNEVIFVAILSACSHAGYVILGRRYFHQMVHGFKIVPSIEHYGCMVDLLGRAGRLAEAEDFIRAMPERPNSVIWGALLGACRTHNDPKRGSLAFKHLTELEPLSGDRYKLAGLMFENSGEKESARTIRKFVEENDLETTHGLSFVEIDGTVSEFVAGRVEDHNVSEEIHAMLDGVNRFSRDN